jgi:hypothetical protein
VLRAQEPVAAPVAPKPIKQPAKKTARAAKQAATPAAVTPAPVKPSGPLPLPLELIRQAIEEGSDEEGWAHLGSVGNYLNKIRPDFDPRLYGQKKLSDLLRQHPRHFKVEERTAPGSSGKTLFVRAVD